MAGGSSSGPGAIRTAEGVIELNADRTAAERIELVIINTGDRPGGRELLAGARNLIYDATTALRFTDFISVPAYESMP